MKNRLLFLTLAVAASSLSKAQQVPSSPTAISLEAENVAYEQNFNTPNLASNSGNHTTMPTGWAFLETGGANGTGEYLARAGGVTRNDTYSIGVGVTAERALGSLVGPNMQNSKIGAKFVNNTGKIITTLLINYYGEQWRRGNSNIPERLKFSYSKTATDLATANVWTTVTDLDFTSIFTSNSAGVGLTGDDAANRKLIGSIIRGLDIQPNEVFWIRWENEGASNTSISVDGNADLLGIDDFSIVPNSAVAPVNLSFFKHQKLNGSVKFNWETASEKENDYFELLRSADGVSFSTVTKIAGQGNTNNKTNYSYTDFDPLGGVNYYQLKQVDFNGDTKIYPTVSVSFGEIELNFTVSNNFTAQIYSPSQSLAEIRVVDMAGKELFKKKLVLLKGYNNVKLDMSGIGVYVAILSTNNAVVKKKFSMK